tara:strand:- start:492 stop:1190 length:699 start_codon:yes stop_codon:yes gene_type:complete
VGAYKKLKWKRVLNECRFLKEETELVKSIICEAAPLFQQHYEALLSEYQLDLNKLNQDNAERIKQAYNISETEEIDGNLPITSSCSSLMVMNKTIEKTEEVQLTEDEIVLHATFSKLFKKVALKIHPDKIDPAKYSFDERRKMSADFKKANDALQNKDYFILLDLAEELDISVPKNYDQQIRWMKHQLGQLVEELQREKSTYSYLFAEKEAKEEKDLLIKQFVKQLFNIDLS